MYCKQRGAFERSQGWARRWCAGRAWGRMTGMMASDGGFRAVFVRDVARGGGELQARAASTVAARHGHAQTPPQQDAKARLTVARCHEWTCHPQAFQDLGGSLQGLQCLVCIAKSWGDKSKRPPMCHDRIRGLQTLRAILWAGLLAKESAQDVAAISPVVNYGFPGP